MGFRFCLREHGNHPRDEVLVCILALMVGSTNFPLIPDRTVYELTFLLSMERLHHYTERLAASKIRMSDAGQLWSFIKGYLARILSSRAYKEDTCPEIWSDEAAGALCMLVTRVAGISPNTQVTIKKAKDDDNKTTIIIEVSFLYCDRNECRSNIVLFVVVYSHAVV